MGTSRRRMMWMFEKAAQRLRGAGLAFLPAGALFEVLDALAFVRLRRTQAADLHRGRAQHLAVDAADGEVERRQRLFRALHLRDFRGDAFGEVEHDRVAEPEREVDLLALHFGAET